MWQCPHHHLIISQVLYFTPNFTTQSKRFSSSSSSPLLSHFPKFLPLFLSDFIKKICFFIGICELQRISYYGFHLFIQFSAHNATYTTFITQSSMLSSYIFLSSSSLSSSSVLHLFTVNRRLCLLRISCQR